MPIDLARTDTYADLGDAWVRHQTALLRQRHVQLGQRCALGLSALLARAARIARAARAAQAMNGPAAPLADCFRRATIEAIDHCARLGARSSAPIRKTSAS
jgi:hypothetical protein